MFGRIESPPIVKEKQEQKEPTEEHTVTKKLTKSSSNFAGHLISLVVVVAYVTHAFDHQMENMKVALIAVGLGYICMKLTELLF